METDTGCDCCVGAAERGVQAAKDAAEYVCRDLAEVVARILEQ